MSDEMEIQDKKIQENMDKIARKILIMSGKGGVGKTTVTVNLANALVSMGCTVGILDTDIHGPNVAKMLGCEDEILQSSEEGGEIQPVCPRPGLKVVSLSFALQDPQQAIVFRGPMKMSVIRQFLADVQWGTLDYLLIDSPPGTGDEQLTVCQSIPSLTGTIIVTTPQQVAILDARRSVTFSRQLQVAILGVIENMSWLSCPDCGKKLPIFGEGGGLAMCSQMGVPFLGQIPMELGLQQNEDLGRNWLEEGKSPSAEAILEIARQLHASIRVSNARDTSFVPRPSSCAPSACASCKLDCPSKK